MDVRHVVRAGFGAFAVLCGPWFLLAALYVYVSLSKGEGVGAFFLCWTIGLCWVVWLLGFKLEINSRELIYRDGLYRKKKILLKEISGVKNTWVNWRVLGRRLKAPRLVVFCGGRGEKMMINIKPFSRVGYQSVYKRLKLIADGEG